MPTPEQLKLMFGAFPVPLILAGILFGAAWRFAGKYPLLYDAQTATGRLDIWALALAFTAGHHTIDGLSGLPPTDALDWLPLGLLALAIVATFKLPIPASNALLIVISVTILGLTLHGFKSYHDTHPLAQRLLIFAAIALALIAGTVCFGILARELSLVDFFLITGIAGTIGAGVLLNGFHTSKLAQILGLTLAIGGAGFVIGIATNTKHVSTPLASAWVLVWTVLVTNAYFGNYQLPQSAPLALLLLVPSAAGIGLLAAPPTTHPTRSRIVVFTATVVTALLAFGLANPAEENSAEERNPYADWGG